ncbi:MAG: thioredoxin family protein [Zavarzinella sp.]
MQLHSFLIRKRLVLHMPLIGLCLIAVSCSDISTDNSDTSSISTTNNSNNEISNGRSSSRAIKPQKKVEFLTFGAKWCAVCRNVPAQLEQLRKTYPKYSFTYLDVDDNMKLSEKYNVNALPYSLIICDGNVVARIKGLIPLNDLTEFIDKTIKTHE